MAQQTDILTGIEEDDIVIRIPKAGLQQVLDGSWMSGSAEIRWRVTDPHLFADQLVNALLGEDEAGNNLVHRMLDQAIESAIENGAEGVTEHEVQGD